MRFTKMQGTGNDFVVVEAKNERRAWPKLAVAMCDRHFGIGADGLLLVLPSEKSDIKMRIFNSDGSEADACGNGTRCMVKYAVEAGLAPAHAKMVSIETRKGVRTALVKSRAGKVIKATVGMGVPEFRLDTIPVIIEGGGRKIGPMTTYPISIDGRTLELNLISMGNPHAVYFTSEPVSDFPLASLGPMIEHHRIFPDRVNFEVARLLGDGRIEGRTWERGAGETLACGSGACAIVVAAKLHGYIENIVDIMEPGGILELEWGGAGEVFLTGPAETVFTGEWPEH